MHKDYLKWMQKEWCWNGDLAQSLQDFSLKLQSWNKDTFGHIFKRKKRNLLRLEGVQRCLTHRITEALLKLESKLKEERSEILFQEELLWQQKSRVQWLRSGDANTKFFHASTLIRQRRNMILTLQDDAGTWIEGKEALQDMALTFYKQLFKSDPKAIGQFPTCLFPQMSEGLQRDLEADYSMIETKRAL